MSPKRLITCAVLALVAALPATANAQQEAPGKGDNLADAIILGTLPLTPHVLGYDVDTSNYTTEPGEFNQCGSTIYGKTVWSAFHAPQYGRLDVTAAGFDSVIGVGELTSSGLKGGPCVDRLAGRIESFPRDNLPTVKKGHDYAIQVGGAQQPDGSIPGGLLSVDVELLPPAVVQGADAILTWRGGGGGIKISSLKIDGPPGSFISVLCSKKSCGKPQGFSVRKTVFKSPIGKLDVTDRRSSTFKPAASTWLRHKRQNVSAAAKSVFKGRKVKNGDTLIVAVEAEDTIGEVFFWKVSHNQAGPKNLGCIEPTDSSAVKIRRIGTCTGQ